MRKERGRGGGGWKSGQLVQWRAYRQFLLLCSQTRTIRLMMNTDGLRSFLYELVTSCKVVLFWKTLKSFNAHFDIGQAFDYNILQKN